MILENETSNIRKPDLNKYLMVNKKFNPSSIDSEEETIKNNRKSFIQQNVNYINLLEDAFF